MNIWTSFVNFFANALKAIAEAVSFFGGHRWAVAIILITLAVKTVLLPLAIKQIKSMREMSRMQPEVKRLQQKYKGDKQRLNTEMMELYKREGVNPLASCLPMLAQFPIMIAMYQAIRHITMPPGDFMPKLEAAKRIALAQQKGLVPRMPFLGLGDLAQHASGSAAGIILLVLYAAIGYLSARQINTGTTPQQQRMQQLMPIFFVVFFLRFPAGLVLYWTTQQLYQYVQQLIMLRTHPVPVAPKAAPVERDRKPAPANRPPARRYERPGDNRNRNRARNKSKRRR